MPKQQDSLKNELKNVRLSYKEQVILLNKLSLHYQSFNLDSALLYNKEIKFISIRKRYPKGVGYYYQNLANVNMYKGNFKAAEQFAKKAQFYFLKAKDTNNFILGVYAQTFALDFQGKYDLAKTLALKTVKAIENQPNNSNIVELYYYLSTIYNESKQPDIAFLYINKALGLYSKKNNFNGIFKCNYQLATICVLNGMNKKAKIYLAKSNEIIRSKFHNKIEFHIKINSLFTLNYIKLNDYNKALQHCKITENYINNWNYDYFSIKNNKLMVEIYIGLKQYSKAILYLNKLDRAEKKNDNDLFQINSLKGQLYYKINEYDKALFFLDKNYLTNPKEIKTVQLISEIHNKLGNFKKAYQYIGQYLQLKDAQFEFEKNNSIAEYEALFQIKDKEIELKNTKLVIKNKEIQLQEQNNYILLSAIIIVALCIVFVLLVFNNYIKKKSIIIIKQKNEALARVNDLLTQSNLEKEILLKEIHHRVKNNLQLVMSLLNIQAQDSQQISIQEFMEKGRLRIATMSLIHQSLYQADNFANINFQEYLENLVTNIKQTFEENSVDVEVQTNGTTFDLDTAIPLGLIINELVCNALKYAFPKDLKGRISIAIEKKEGQSYELRISDNGVGVVDKVTPKVAKSIGLELVSLLVKQLQGTLKQVNQAGTHYTIQFTSY